MKIVSSVCAFLGPKSAKMETFSFVTTAFRLQFGNEVSLSLNLLNKRLMFLQFTYLN